jgi:hypothetical protein
MTPTLEMAFAKAAELPEATQDQVAGMLADLHQRYLEKRT